GCGTGAVGHLVRYGDFSVASIRKVIDDKFLPNVSSNTRWVIYVPMKVNILAWKVKMDALPVRFNLSRRGRGRTQGTSEKRSALWRDVKRCVVTEDAHKIIVKTNTWSQSLGTESASQMHRTNTVTEATTLLGMMLLAKADRFLQDVRTARMVIFGKRL
nr:RNA-directed DNA polymerase, eukaryota [Tanacetum cinerariifolium]